MTKTEIVVTTLTKLTADEGHYLTNGNAYGKEVYLGDSDSADNWHEITDKKYETIAEQEKLSQEMGDLIG